MIRNSKKKADDRIELHGSPMTAYIFEIISACLSRIEHAELRRCTHAIPPQNSMNRTNVSAMSQNIYP